MLFADYDMDFDMELGYLATFSDNVASTSQLWAEGSSSSSGSQESFTSFAFNELTINEEDPLPFCRNRRAEAINNVEDYYPPSSPVTSPKLLPERVQPQAVKVSQPTYYTHTQTRSPTAFANRPLSPLRDLDIVSFSFAAAVFPSSPKSPMRHELLLDPAQALRRLSVV